MKLNLKKSRYLTKEEAGENGIVDTIESFTEENVAPTGAKPDVRWVAHLRSHKPFVLNATNGELLTEMFGSDDADGWIGRPIELFNDLTVIYNGKRGGIRVRRPGSGRASSPPPRSLPEAVAKADGADVERDIPW